MRALVVLLIATLLVPAQTGAGTRLVGSVLGTKGIHSLWRIFISCPRGAPSANL